MWDALCSTVRLGKELCKLDPLIGAPFGARFEVAGNELRRMLPEHVLQAVKEDESLAAAEVRSLLVLFTHWGMRDVRVFAHAAATACRTSQRCTCGRQAVVLEWRVLGCNGACWGATAHVRVFPPPPPPRESAES